MKIRSEMFGAIAHYFEMDVPEHFTVYNARKIATGMRKSANEIIIPTTTYTVADGDTAIVETPDSSIQIKDITDDKTTNRGRVKLTGNAIYQRLRGEEIDNTDFMIATMPGIGIRRPSLSKK